mmetsp:Transcript_88818/g.246734  ORF Transcript_88818/g.246734 Transcript_88818/m.246734 type:complete len:258 (+) Transcript_88818:175-948(+)
MDSDSLPLSASTPRTRTCTVCPTSSTSATSATKPCCTCEMCTRPLPGGPPAGLGTSMNAPKFASPATVPVSHSSSGVSWKPVRSTFSRRGSPAPVSNTFIVRLKRPAARSTDRTRTRTSCPTCTQSSTRSTYASVSSVMWTKPLAMTGASPGGVTSTKAPKVEMEVTVPSSHSSPPARGSKGLRSTGSSAAFGFCSFFMDSDSLPPSTLSTRTLTSWPMETSAPTSPTKPSRSCVMCTRPRASASPPPGGFTATKAP